MMLMMMLVIIGYDVDDDDIYSRISPVYL